MSDILFIEEVWMESVMDGLELPDFSEFVKGFEVYQNEKNGEWL